jgi:hypothetical protein
VAATAVVVVFRWHAGDDDTRPTSSLLRAGKHGVFPTGPPTADADNADECIKMATVVAEEKGVAAIASMA